MSTKISKQNLKRIGEVLYEVPKDFREDMRVPARLYGDETILEDALEDLSVEQLVNTATLPGVVRYTLAMPDVHQGYGFPIGGVVATELPHGVISPGGVGYDINCGVRLLVANIHRDELLPHVEAVTNAFFHEVPMGVGRGGDVKLSRDQTDQLLEKGAAWAVKHGYGSQEDLECTEESGAMPGADASKVSNRAKERGKDQVGTLGSGNHFVELQEVTEIYDRAAANTLGLFEGQIAVQVHSGSRGLGHQVCTDYVQLLQRAIAKYGIKIPDRELVCVPFDSPEGRDYFAAMAAAANYAWANRQMLAQRVRQAFDQVLAGKIKDRTLRQIYDVAHNIAKVEEYTIDGRKVKLCVHRKGATRAFGPGRREVPAAYRQIGQPVLIPGSMGTASYVLVGTQEAMETTFGSTCHGAGRVLSRTKARRETRGEEVVQELAKKGIIVRGVSQAGIAEEAPEAYKDIDRVVNVVSQAGLARKVAKLRPLGVIKG